MMGESAGLVPATGRPGRAVTTRGASAAAHLPQHTPAGYEPTELDAMLRSYVAAAEVSIRTAESLGKKVEKAVTDLIDHMKDGPSDALSAATEAEGLTKLHERLSKANLNLVKSTDELTRLRSFLAGGPDSRPDLTARGELELVQFVLQKMTALGWTIRDQHGRELTVEVA